MSERASQSEPTPRSERTPGSELAQSVGRAPRSGRAVLGRAAFLVAALLAAGYWLVVRPWHRRWGATDEEARRPLPGDGLLPTATDQVTHAITIDAPASDVWPWLVQLGQGRGGFYSYDWLENLVGADIHNADRILPEHQRLAVGDTVRLAPTDYPLRTPDSALAVAHVDPERALVARSPAEPPNFTWAFVLDEQPDETTRFIVRMRSGPRGGLLATVTQLLGWEPAHFVMERQMLRGVKARAEATRVERRMAATGEPG
ncbi:MAG TPA: hypothetical protein VKA37_12350 [Halobacteriales archaeon]|nr:hypothetical protein [Halobacteriales archaeon]